LHHPGLQLGYVPCEQTWLTTPSAAGETIPNSLYLTSDPPDDLRPHARRPSLSAFKTKLLTCDFPLFIFPLTAMTVVQ
jgi:hypothetical protein